MCCLFERNCLVCGLETSRSHSLEGIVNKLLKISFFVVAFPSICLTTSKPLNNCTALTAEVYNVSTVNAVKKIILVHF